MVFTVSLNSHPSHSTCTVARWGYSVRFSLSTDWGVGDMRDGLAEILPQCLQMEPIVSSSGMGQGCPRFDDAHSHFLCRPQRLDPFVQDALKDDFGEAVLARDVPEPCEFASLDSCQKRIPWAHKEVDFAPQQVVGLVLQEGDEKFTQLQTGDNQRKNNE